MLTLRFCIILDNLWMRIKEIRDISQLEQLLEWAVLEPSVDAFTGQAMEM